MSDILKTFCLGVKPRQFPTIEEGTNIINSIEKKTYSFKINLYLKEKMIYINKRYYKIHDFYSFFSTIFAFTYNLIIQLTKSL